nr:hypothetical protein [Tanacetum cinerariifolium]
MATSMEIVYAPKVKACLIIGAVQFLNNNVVGYFNYPMKVPTYKYLGNIQPDITGPQNSPPKDGTHKSKIFLKRNLTNPKDLEGNKQPTDMGLLSNPNDGIHQSKSFPEGKPTDPQDIERNKHLAITRLPATNPDEGIGKLQLLPKGTLTDTKESRINIQLTNRGLTSITVNDQLGVAEDNWAKHEEAVASYADLK